MYSPKYRHCNSCYVCDHYFLVYEIEFDLFFRRAGKNIMHRYIATLRLLKLFFCSSNIMFSYNKCNLNLEKFPSQHCIVNFTCDINFTLIDREKKRGTGKKENEACKFRVMKVAVRKWSLARETSLSGSINVTQGWF